MKKILKINSLLVILIVMFNMLFPILSIATEEQVTITFKDKNLYNAILTEINDKIESSNEETYTINITKTNLEAIASLKLASKEITNISGIENFTTLINLDLGDNLISNIEPLSQLTSLTWLNLNNNKNISDISPISTLTNLTNLYIGGNKISDITRIAPLLNLTSLAVYSNEISDVTLFGRFIKLTWLNLGANNISDITPLSRLTNLKTLYLNDNHQISDIEPLSSLTNLTYLSLSENKISDITPLSNLTNLEILYLNSNEINNIEPFSSLTKLKHLLLSNNEIQSFEPISNLKTLSALGAYNTQISDISFLKNLTNMRTLLISNNNINNISELANLKELGILSLCGNPNLKDVSALANCTKLEKLYLHNNDIEDISKLNTLVNLKELGIGGNKIKDLSVIDQLPSLKLTNEWQTVTTDLLETVSSNYQTIEMVVNESDAENGVNLPQIFIKSKDQNSKLYTKEALELENCTLSSDGTKITFNENTDEATATIKGGALADTKLTIKINDDMAPVLDVKYSTTEKTNGSVTVKIISNEKLKAVNGWNLSEDQLVLTKEYSQNKEEELIVCDLAGNERKISIKVNNIEKSDNTTADSPIPQTGKNITISISIAFIMLISIVEYIKLKKFKEIK